MGWWVLCCGFWHPLTCGKCHARQWDSRYLAAHLGFIGLMSEQFNTKLLWSPPAWQGFPNRDVPYCGVLFQFPQEIAFASHRVFHCLPISPSSLLTSTRGQNGATNTWVRAAQRWGHGQVSVPGPAQLTAAAGTREEKSVKSNFQPWALFLSDHSDLFPSLRVGSSCLLCIGLHCAAKTALSNTLGGFAMRKEIWQSQQLLPYKGAGKKRQWSAALTQRVRPQKDM